MRNSQCQSCPVCHGRLQRTPEEIAQHVEDCLRKVKHHLFTYWQLNPIKV